ncbi:hypothetical protein DICVIV_01119 [Dictyocaulus viviparus]|uniref:Uncharacterized protein n=1 Tax=Dictyocaulus viviparus TaxID=29172 RepID=A0A0D8Y716_DICVI|nr:hypothetical protein DICVIV_01119 [Dictyocaulus viviparus]
MHAIQIPRPSSTRKPSETRRQSTTETNPRSPLMTVAKTVKNKFSKLTRIGRHDQDVSMKGSQSFSGIRQPKSAIPKQIDQNANRVIKSSSMEVPSNSHDTAEPFRGRCMVVIPQDPKKLEDFSEEGSIANTIIQADADNIVMEDINEHPTLSDESKQALSVTLKEDMLVVTQNQNFSLLLQSGQQWNPNKKSEEYQREQENVLVLNELQRSHMLTEGEIQEKLREKFSPSAKMDICPISSSESRTFITGFEKSQNSELEFTEAHHQRKHHIFVLGEKIPDTSSELVALESKEVGQNVEEKPVKGFEVEEIGVASNFVMAIPESLSEHRTFIISSTEPPTNCVDEASSSKKKKQTKVIKQRSMPESYVPPEKYVMTMKTPESLRRHHTFTIRERTRSPDVPYIEEDEITQPQATVGPAVVGNKAWHTKIKEVEKPSKRFTMTVKTPSTSRRSKTYIIEEKQEKKPFSVSRSVESLTTVTTNLAEGSKFVEKHAKHSKASFSKIQKCVESDKDKRNTETEILNTTPVLSENSPHTLGVEKGRAVHESETLEIIKETDPVVELMREREISETEPLKTAEMYVLTMMTPISSRKADSQRNADDKLCERTKSPEDINLSSMYGHPYNSDPQKSKVKETDPVVELMREREISETEPLKTAEMYVLTMMTPISSRKADSQRNADDKLCERTKSPEDINLSSMYGHPYNSDPQKSKVKVLSEKESTRCAVVRPHMTETMSVINDQSQSDRAEPIERKTSDFSVKTLSYIYKRKQTSCKQNIP